MSTVEHFSVLQKILLIVSDHFPFNEYYPPDLMNEFCPPDLKKEKGWLRQIDSLLGEGFFERVWVMEEKPSETESMILNALLSKNKKIIRKMLLARNEGSK